MAVVKWLQLFLQQESNATRAALGLAIAGHVVIALLLVLGAFNRTEAASVVTIPVEIVTEEPDTQAPSSPAPASKEQSAWSGIPAVADVDKRAKASPATQDVNGADLPKQPRHDGGDPSPDPAANPVPPADGDLASGSASLPSWAVEPIGLAQRQMTARESHEDEMTATKEPKDPASRKGNGDSNCGSNVSPDPIEPAHDGPAYQSKIHQ
jgi:multisubunit Na+/H+ antiporter MnhC subunit